VRIYDMTAAFGKLEHATLELKPGLNIITAPNEWGKSTWCAFLVAMLYGLDTRAKTTKTSLADKERYAPWSGSPMAGRIDLNWNGRNITIERRTKRRVPLGEFQAYETASGLPVTELTAANCGAMLLGVEQSVFRRAGFIRHADLPVTQDEALRRRLNALVTTGDDSGAADRLAEDLKTLRNRCRYNRSGLIPQAEAQRDSLLHKLGELEALSGQTQRLKTDLETIDRKLTLLQNHRQTLAYNRLEADTARVAQAAARMEQTESQREKLEQVCAELPSQEDVHNRVRELRAFREQWSDMQQELYGVPSEPEKPEMDPPFTGMTPEQAREMVRSDAKEYVALAGSKMAGVLLLVGFLGILAAAGLTYVEAYLYGAIAGLAGVLAMAWGFWERRDRKKKLLALMEKYGDPDWKHWMLPIGKYEHELRRYEAERKDHQEIRSDLEVRLMVLRNKREALCGEDDSETVLAQWEEALSRWDACLRLRRESEQAREHYELLAAMVKPVEKPEMADELTCSAEETERLLEEGSAEQQRLQNRLGQYQGRMEQLGDPEELRSQLKQVRNRLTKLEETYEALEIAMDILAAARAELQRRFAPRITQRAQKLMETMTGGRYHSLTMSEDFSIQAGAGQEETLHDAIWRSDGTMDQLYLALRLAVAEELTPNAPLILDDVLVRYDDRRMEAAVKLLKQLAENRQVIFFTCQGREAAV